ncbi:uncharacterized protein [Argopecten irradians]|uniref:uncharacterized protein n=1 Tax=Argopecten irradians TaxID=31199 RepID=UPI003714C132
MTGVHKGVLAFVKKENENIYFIAKKVSSKKVDNQTASSSKGGLDFLFSKETDSNQSKKQPDKGETTSRNPHKSDSKKQTDSMDNTSQKSEPNFAAKKAKSIYENFKRWHYAIDVEATSPQTIRCVVQQTDVTVSDVETLATFRECVLIEPDIVLQMLVQQDIIPGPVSDNCLSILFLSRKNSSDSKSVIRTAPKKKAKSTSKRRRDSERLRKFRETKKVLCIFPFSDIENSELQNDFQKDSNYNNQIISLQSKLVRTKITISKISEKCAKLQRSNEILEEECARAKNVNITNYVSQIKELEKALDNRKKIMKSKDETISTLQTTAKQKEQTQRQIANLKFKISEKDEELKTETKHNHKPPKTT